MIVEGLAIYLFIGAIAHMWDSHRAIREQRRKDPTTSLAMLLHKLDLEAAGPILIRAHEQRVRKIERFLRNP